MLIYNGICSEIIQNKVLKDNYFLSQVEWFFERKDTDIFFILFLLLSWHIYIFIFNEYIVSLNSYQAINSRRLKSNIN